MFDQDGSPYNCLYYLVITRQAEPLLTVRMLPPRRKIKAKRDQRGSARWVPDGVYNLQIVIFVFNILPHLLVY